MMNNRIFELAKQVDLIQWDKLPSGAITPDHKSVVKAKKFAELIVQECVNLIQSKVSMKFKDGGNGETEDYMGGHYAASLLARVVIKQHFGVE
jgi:hypothetical protein